MKPTTQTFWKIVILSTLVFFFSWLGVYKLGVNQLPIQSEDTLPAMFLPVTIIQEGTIYLDSYYDLFLQHYPHPEDRTREKGLLPFYLRQAHLT